MVGFPLCRVLHIYVKDGDENLVGSVTLMRGNPSM